MRGQEGKMSQKKYLENGAFYITTRDCLTISKSRYSGRLGIVEMPLERSFQLDSVEDLCLLKKLLPPSLF